MNDFLYYKSLSVEELMEDPECRRWLLHHSDENNRYWQDFLYTYPSQKSKIDEARSCLIATNEFFETEVTTDVIEQRLNSILAQAEKGFPRVRKNRFRIFWSVITIAALLTGMLFFSLIGQDVRPVQYLTDYGQWEQVELPDGSLVNLNANSKLVLDENWENGEERKVWLEGEAYFDVQKKQTLGTKFKVMTGGLIIEVLGTKFNVQNRGLNTEIFLKEGKIKLDLNGEIEYMEPGQFIIYSPEKKAIIKRNRVPQESYTSWIDGTLQMNATTEDLLNRISEIYGVEFIVEDSSVLKEMRTFAVPMQQLDMVIPILETSLNMKIIKDGNKLVIR